MVSKVRRVGTCVMADWGSYLKNAVANVEQQLDKVLLEQPASVTAKPKPKRPDLNNRLKRAANGKSPTPDATTNPEAVKTVETEAKPETKEIKTKLDDSAEAGPENVENVEEDVPEDFVAEQFAIAPDLGAVVTQARQLALAVERDDAVALVDALELEKSELDTYIDSMSARMQAANQKLKTICGRRTESDTVAQRQIALLMEEGQRLSQQELNLGLLLKKIRTERSAALTKADSVVQKDQEIQKLHSIIAADKSKTRELEALVEYFRGLAEREGSSHRGDPEEKQPVDDTVIAERAKWHALETDLLSRIVELEQACESAKQSQYRVQETLAAAQEMARESRDVAVELQDRLDAQSETAAVLETQLRSEITELRLANEHSVSERTLLVEQKSALQAENRELLERIAELEKPMCTVGYSCEPEVEDAEIVGPSGPFGEYAINDEPNNDTSSVEHMGVNMTDPSMVDPSMARESMVGDRSSMMGSLLDSRRESSLMVESDASTSNLVKRLMLQIRKLENDVSVARKAAEFARQQRESTEAELLKLVEAQEQFHTLQTTHEKLEREFTDLQFQVKKHNELLSDKNVRIDELEADVGDLKDMYKEQVEALVSEIEHLKEYNI